MLSASLNKTFPSFLPYFSLADSEAHILALQNAQRHLEQTIVELQATNQVRTVPSAICGCRQMVNNNKFGYYNCLYNFYAKLATVNHVTVNMLNVIKYNTTITGVHFIVA